MLKLGIIGEPLSHSLSPLLHTHVLQRMSLAGEYRAYEVPEAALAETLARFAREGGTGLNVTIPHKRAVMPLCTTLSREAQLVGAVNTLIYREGGWHGDNTDALGFRESLPGLIVDRLPGSQVLIIGAGGAARAVLAALISLKTAQVMLAVRSPEKALNILAEAERMKTAYQSPTELGLVAWEEAGHWENLDGVVNATPVGMAPDLDRSPLDWSELQSLSAGAWVYDLVYRPLHTRLLTDAMSLGLETIDGLGMLIRQGVASFERWSGYSVPEQITRELHPLLTDALLAQARPSAG